MVAGLGNEPRELPARILARRGNYLGKKCAVLLGCDLVRRPLMCVRLALVPEQRPEPMFSVWRKRIELMNTLHQSFEQRPIALPHASCHLSGELRHRRLSLEVPALGKPLPHAGRAVSHRRNADGHMVLRVHRIAERRNEAAFAT